MIDHLNPYLASTLVAERLEESTRARRNGYHAAQLRAQRTRRRPRRRLVSQ
ncbi:MAG TPA: hypothetical protein VFG72_07165 [Marmoricola sp.]|nr:hypothetical protein [Marmoricola sp.]